MNPIAALSDMMIEVLKFFYGISGNYGIAIILLTIAMKLALYPLTVQSTVQMKAMSNLSPKLSELQKKHKGKPDVLQRETMDLYKQHGVNPLGGCLPMLLQIPIFIAIFFALTSPAFKEVINTSGVTASFLWMPDLSKPDILFYGISPMMILIALSTYWSSKSMSMGPQQQPIAMLYFMPIFIAFISAAFPSGVQLYWVVSNILTVAQQAYILKSKS
jgi:YidC/Oxa1 family membrane protein insertase